MTHTMVFGPNPLEVELPDGAAVIGSGLSLPLAPCEDLEAEIRRALTEPLDGAPLRARVSAGASVTVAFDDPTVPCYAPVWAVALPMILDELAAGGVRDEDITLVCANSLHRQFTHEEIAAVVGSEVVAAHAERLVCHDAEDPGNMVELGRTPSGYHVTLSRKVVESDLVIYLNCSTTRGFSGGWKSICVGLSDYRSIHHHHTPDVMSMSLDRNQMHQMLDEMGAVVDESLGDDRIFKIETILASPFTVHHVVGGSVWATRKAALEVMRAAQPARRDLIDEQVDVVLYGVPDWSPYAAFSHTNPILDVVSTGLGYLGGMIQALGRPGCTVILATPCPIRWNETHHPAYREVWEEVLPQSKDPEQIRREQEPVFARRDDYIDLYRHHNAFHPVHATMALYPLKRLRHAGRVIVAGTEDPLVPERLGLDYAPDVATALGDAGALNGSSLAFVDYPMAFNRSL